jgi:hypothetical protein
LTETCRPHNFQPTRQKLIKITTQRLNFQIIRNILTVIRLQQGSCKIDSYCAELDGRVSSNCNGTDDCADEYKNYNKKPKERSVSTKRELKVVKIKKADSFNKKPIDDGGIWVG